jgi:hypothetical protein
VRKDTATKRGSQVNKATSIIHRRESLKSVKARRRRRRKRRRSLKFETSAQRVNYRLFIISYKKKP